MSSRIKNYGNGASQSLTDLLKSKGIWYVGKKGFFQYLFSHIHPLIKPGEFSFNGRSLSYCNAKYNNSFANERTVEIAIALDVLQSFTGKECLEVGNVLSHYTQTSERDIVDKYEFGPEVINADIVEYNPDKKYDLIISLSTIEHVGFDEEHKDPDKIKTALNHMIQMLAEGGTMLVTFPLGWNSNLDEDFDAGTLPFKSMTVLRREGLRNTWKEINAGDQRGPYHFGTYIGADLVVVGLYQN